MQVENCQMASSLSAAERWRISAGLAAAAWRRAYEAAEKAIADWSNSSLVTQAAGYWLIAYNGDRSLDEKRRAAMESDLSKETETVEAARRNEAEAARWKEATAGIIYVRPLPS